MVAGAFGVAAADSWSADRFQQRFGPGTTHVSIYVKGHASLVASRPIITIRGGVVAATWAINQDQQ